ncbi:MAG: DUF5074 domain-containing protein [Bacteroidetes bacterium]|nr:DUF5074 domain-containing protein [Bacteroidota bacterium]
MKKKFLFKLLMPLVAIFATMASCTDYSNDIDNLRDRVTVLEKTVNEMNTQVKSVQTLVTALENKDYILDVKELSDKSGYTITFAKKGVVTIKNGANGKDAPIISIKKDDGDGKFYWTKTIEGKELWLEADGKKIAVTGNDGTDGTNGTNGTDGKTPILGVNSDGYWTIDKGDGNGVVRLLDENNDPIKAKGNDGTNGTDGDSFFKNVDTSDSRFVTFTLTNDTAFTIPRIDAEISFIKKFVLLFGETKNVRIKIKNIQTAEFLSIPDGWSATLNLEDKRISITAPVNGSGAESGILSIIGIDKNGNTILASTEVVCSVDYSNINGTFIVEEGNMTSENGTIIYYDELGNIHKKIYENANGGVELGNVVQDMYISDNKTYFLTQNGSAMGGEGRFIVCNSKTMEKDYALELTFNSVENVLCWPQHIVVYKNKAFIQYSTSNMELNSGIRIFNLTTKTISDTDIVGTYGQFTKTGATKARMILNKETIFAGRGEAVVLIDANSGEVIKTVTFAGTQVKSVAKNKDGNICVAISGTYVKKGYSYEFTSKSKIVTLDIDGNIVKEFELPEGLNLPVASWTPSVNMCSSFTEPYMYFALTNSSGFSMNRVARYNYETNDFDADYITATPPDLYGYLGIHPTTEKLFVGKSINGYTGTAIEQYSTGDTPSMDKRDEFPKGSPAGVDFAYRFTTEWVNK